METHKRLSKVHTIQDIFDMATEPKEIDMDDLKPLTENILKNKPKLLTPEHSRRVERVDLEYPIIVAYMDGRYVKILDGHHRIVKSLKNNIDTIKVRVLDLTEYDSDDRILIAKLVKILYWYWSNDNNYDTDHQYHIPKGKNAAGQLPLKAGFDTRSRAKSCLNMNDAAAARYIGRL